MKNVRFEMQLTPEQHRLLEFKSKAAGFSHKSEYIRFVLFMEISIAEKIDEILKRLKDDRGHSCPCMQKK